MPLKRILPFILIILLVFGSAHYFIFQVASRSLVNASLNTTLVLALMLGLISMPLSFWTRSKNKNFNFVTWYGFIWMGYFSILLFLCCLEAVLFYIWDHPYSYWVIPISLLIGLWSLVKGLSQPRIIRHNLKKSELAGLKLVQISDLHIGMLHLDEVWLKKVVERINELTPDVIVVTGDLVEGTFQEIVPKLQVFKKLTHKAKKYYITGNHEYINGSGSWETAMSNLDFKILHNENDIVNFNKAKVLIAGIPDRTIGRFLKNKFSLPDLALSTSENSDFKILLAHQPASVFDIKSEKCDLILSGHTHGGQIFPFHLLVRLAQPVVAGFKVINNILVFAHQGTGFWGPPMRWFSRSEIVLFEWY